MLPKSEPLVIYPCYIIVAAVWIWKATMLVQLAPLLLLAVYEYLRITTWLDSNRISRDLDRQQAEEAYRRVMEMRRDRVTMMVREELRDRRIT